MSSQSSSQFGCVLVFMIPFLSLLSQSSSLLLIKSQYSEGCYQSSVKYTYVSIVCYPDFQLRLAKVCGTVEGKSGVGTQGVGLQLQNLNHVIQRD